ncbi:MAG TPA: glycosyltransferase family 2 protein [Cytophagales bacterium]|nr:glycosyltransferase family 2 protein [Cytophagales bacterium]
MIYVVVPVFNEEAIQLRQNLLALLKFHYNIVLVNDGWNKELKESIADLPIHYIRHSVNLGQGAALQTGVEYALLHNAEFIVHFDADGQHNPENIADLIKPLINGEAEIALGSRFLANNTVKEIPPFRRFILFLARFVNYIFTGMLLSDAHNGLRAMTRKAAEQIFLTENSYAHATQILSEIRKNKLNYKEIPVTIYYSQYSTNKGQKSFNMFNIFLDLILNKIFR